MKLEIGENWRRLPLVPKFLVTSGITILILLNIQPWTDIGSAIANEIKVIPLVGAISSLPLIGGLVGGFVDQILTWVLFTMDDIFSIVVWGIIQYAQLMMWFFDGSGWISAAAYVVEFIMTLFKYEIYGSGFEDFLQDFGIWDLGSWNWFQLIMSVFSMFGAEFGIGIIQNMWQVIPGSKKTVSM